MNGNEEMSQTQSAVRSCPNNQNESVFHAVYIPQKNGETQADNSSRDNSRVYQDKLEALKVIREYKTGRLKTFKTRSEAEEYALTGHEDAASVNNGVATPKTSVTEEKSNNFKAPRSQELVCFRKLIESGDIEAVKSTVWGNPRYLISSGDTPAILHEGCRYNALHYAVKADKPELCEFVLNTVGNAEFIQLLYGEDDSNSYVDRAQIMSDLYLNTPDKGLNETPLHFAVKFGLKDVVRVLVSYPQCVKTLPNKYKQMPIDMICTRKCQEDEELKKDIRMLLEDQYYVPVLRADDKTLQPVIGEPFSPTNPVNFKRDPISPRVEVRAFAGPMTKSRALEFRKKWKTPPRLRLIPAKAAAGDQVDDINNSTDNISLKLKDTEKGLERIGRDLAEEYQVSWKEYWPFLNGFADFRCRDGLTKLEKHLEHKFQDRLSYCNLNTNEKKESLESKKEANDDIDDLCSKLESCTLLNMHNEEEEEDTDDLEYFTPSSSPTASQDSSGDEMELAEEGSAVFLEGSEPTKLDHAVFNALPSSIDLNMYPNIYRWQHDMQLAMKHDSYRSDNTRMIRRKLILNY